MKFLIVDTDYREFLGWLYSEQPGLDKARYAEQLEERMKSLFGIADFYSSNLRKLGHDAWDVHANNEFMQKAWAGENGVKLDAPFHGRPWGRASQILRNAIAAVPLRDFGRLAGPVLHLMDGNGQRAWFYDILAAQIERYKPDVLFNHDLRLDEKFLRDMRAHIRLLVGQHAASPLPPSKDWSCYDLIVSSFVPTVEFFRQQGIASELSRLGFEPSVLSCLGSQERSLDITFVGSFYRVHKGRTKFLEALCRQFSQLKIWGPEPNSLPYDSPIRRCYMGQAWGRKMYGLLHQSKIVLNHHGEIPPYANNLRLFEATGMGALLVTDWKENLKEMFEPGKEIVAYRTPEECIELVNYYLEHEEARASIARAGQQRTLSEHTYYHRMEKFVDLVREYL